MIIADKMCKEREEKRPSKDMFIGLEIAKRLPLTSNCVGKNVYNHFQLFHGAF